ncbi:hypothetical protein [Spiroplasma endosymbiont of Amphibalanus improvisus]|uniref:hypothetical protein n=1 Tax=Spiroplasma endosymbiont of Amphibalanus improvisus TaxID=3066327 RepID=UPI00313C31B1
MSLSAETVMYNYKKKIEFFNKNIDLVKKIIKELMDRIKSTDVSGVKENELKILETTLEKIEKDIVDNDLINKVLEMKHVDLESAKRVNNFLQKQMRDISSVKQKALFLEDEVIKEEAVARFTALKEIKNNDLDKIKKEILSKFENNSDKTKINIFFNNNSNELQKIKEKNLKEELTKLLNDHFINVNIIKNNMIDNFNKQIVDDKFIKKELKEEIEIFKNKDFTSKDQLEIETNDLQLKILNKQLDESIRKESIKVIVENIQKRGFIVPPDNIRMIEQNNEKIVRIYAEKSSGEIAQFNVYIDGRFKYEFGGYEGHTHDKDNDAFINDLSMYDISLSTEVKKKYDNPDREMGQSKKYQNQNVIKK